MDVMLSVIIPIYNSEKYINKCVQSVMAQTYKNLEIILIDDGSTDNSGKVCDKLAESDRRIKTYHTENCGCLATRNYGVSVAQGKLITFVDSDDWIESDMYMQMLESYYKYDPDIISSGLIYENTIDSGMEEYELIPEGVYNKRQIEQDVIPIMMFDTKKRRRAVIPSVCTKVIRKDLWKEVLQQVDNRITYGEDASACYLCLAKAGKAVFINNAWYHYCIYNDSQVHSFDINSFEKIKFFVDYMEAAYKKIGIWEKTKEQLKEYVKQFLYPAIETVYGIKIGDPIYLFPYKLIKADSRIVLYGAGKVGRAYMRNLIKTDYAKVVAWVDKAYDKCTDLGDQIKPPSILSKINFDYIVIAIEDYGIVERIIENLYDIGINKDKLIWEQPERVDN